MKTHPLRILAVLIPSLVACPAQQHGPEQPKDAKNTYSIPSLAPAPPPPEPSFPAADANDHRVVFADRTSQGYLLLVEGPKPATPTRARLAELVQSKLEAHHPEVELLLRLIEIDPDAAQAQLAPSAGADEHELRRTSDLLGLHLDTLDTQAPGDTPLISSAALQDPVLTRSLTAKERESLPKRRYALLLRADYRNQHAVRGLRLLQTLVRLLAEERKAFIHDPDTSETMNVETFATRRLQTSLGNVADQVAVIPFPDRRHGEDHMRLTTRGMRRFGSPDLEFDGLPRDPVILQKATHLVYGLAYQMIVLGEVDRSGLAIELDDIVTVHYRDIAQAYSARTAKLPRCNDCSEQVQLHLVNREREPQDPHGHIVVRIVAPRPTSDAAGYQQEAWAVQAVADLVGG